MRNRLVGRLTICKQASQRQGPFCFWIGILVVWLPSLLHSADIFNVHYDKPGGAQVRLESLASQPPLWGFLSVRAFIKNHTLQDMRWTIKSRSHGGVFEPSLTDRSNLLNSLNTLFVPANEERNLELLIPVATLQSQPVEEVIFDLIGSGIDSMTEKFPPTISCEIPSEPPVFTKPRFSIAFDSSLPPDVLKSISRLDPQQSGSSVLDFFSCDWRAYSGYDHLVIAASAWTKLEKAQRLALRHWCALGGNLILVVPVDFGADALPAAGPYGFGQMFVVSTEEFLARYLPTPPSISSGWNLGMLLDQYFGEGGQRAMKHSWRNVFWVAGLGVIFTILVGPVNLMVFAPRGKRSRILWTTPLIALGASGIFFLNIFIQQDIGGRGSRTLLAFQLPDEPFTALWQEQTSRTGLLSRTDFQSSLPLLLLPLPGAGHILQSSYTLRNGNQWGGDWFLPFSTQAQIAATILPSVHGIAVLPGDASTPPSLAGKLDANIQSLFYIRRDGSVWRLANSALVPSSSQDFTSWLDEVASGFGPVLRERLDRVRERLPSAAFPGWKTGLIFAKYGGLEAIPTLPSIRWTDAPALLITPPAAPAAERQ